MNHKIFCPHSNLVITKKGSKLWKGKFTKNLISVVLDNNDTLDLVSKSLKYENSLHPMEERASPDQQPSNVFEFIK